METVKRDLHQSTAQCSALLTRYSKLAASASTSYSASGLVKDDLATRRTELEDEITAAFNTVSILYSVWTRRPSQRRGRLVALTRSPAKWGRILLPG
jgi:hypothetical protein